MKRRSARAVWLGWAVALLVHVVFLAEHGPAIDLTVLWPTALVLGSRGLRSERHLWIWLGATLLLVGAFAPSHFAATAVMVAAVLVLWAHRSPTLVSVRAQLSDPYRALPDEPPRWPVWVLAPTPAAQVERLLAAAWTSLYVGLWTMSWHGGPWPGHIVWIDALYVTGAGLWMWRTRKLSLLCPLAASMLHLVVAEQLVPAPQSKLQWSLTTIGGRVWLAHRGSGGLCAYAVPTGSLTPARADEGVRPGGRTPSESGPSGCWRNLTKGPVSTLSSGGSERCSAAEFELVRAR